WVRTCVFLLAGFLIIASPYLFFLRSETGSWRLSGKTEGVLLWSQAVGSRNMVAAVDALHSQGDRPPARISPLAFAKRGIMNLHLFDKYILRDLFPSLVLVFVGFGLAAMPLTRPGLFLLSGILPSLALLFFNADARLLLPLSALGVLWSAHGISCVSVRIAEKIGPLRWIRPAVLGAVLFSLLPYTLRPYYRPDENRAYRQAGEWLKEHQKGSLAVMFRKPWVAYYAEATSVALPLGNAETVLEYGRTHGASHLVVDNRVIPNLRPELVHLQTSSCAPMGLDHLKTFQDPPTGTRVLIYRLSDPGAGSPGRTPP
ncbi:MAG: hypothetical protein O2954_19920, partial [bacterium]|nr:hypothetical protein [bacterium]